MSNSPVIGSANNSIYITNNKCVIPTYVDALIRKKIVSKRKANNEISLAQTDQIGEEGNDLLKKKVMQEFSRVEKIWTQKEMNIIEMSNSFNDLQKFVKNYNKEITVPTLIVIGCQSAGKSSLIQALAGFKCNYVNNLFATKRPLLLQLITDHSKDEPHCVFLNYEESDKEFSVPYQQVSDEIHKFNGKESEISDKPIKLNIYYKYSSNLLIVDLPGFRFNSNEVLSQDIIRCVEHYLQDENAILVGVESITDWSNTFIIDYIKKFDPTLERSIIVSSKLDEKLKTIDSNNVNSVFPDVVYNSKQEVFKNIYCIDLLNIGNISNMQDDLEEFMKNIIKRHLISYISLCRYNWDENKYANNYGFFKLRVQLQYKLKQHFKISFMHCKNFLQNILQNLNVKMEAIDRKIDDNNNDYYKIKVINIIKNFCKKVHNKLVNPSNDVGSGNLICEGMTLTEENEKYWKEERKYDVQDKAVLYSDLKLYGSAQLERALYEFVEICKEVKIDIQNSNNYVNVLGLSNIKNKTMKLCEMIQNLIVQQFKEYIGYLLEKCKFIVTDLYKNIIKEMNLGQKYSMLIKVIENKCDNYLEMVLQNVKSILLTMVETITMLLNRNDKYLMANDFVEKKEETVVQNISAGTFFDILEQFQSSSEMVVENESIVKSLIELFNKFKGPLILLLTTQVRLYFIKPLIDNFEDAICERFIQLSNYDIIKFLQLSKDYRIVKQNLLKEIKMITDYIQLCNDCLNY
ncbi:hypothetical protein ABK040_007731 [Willaertia magna]